MEKAIRDEVIKTPSEQIRKNIWDNKVIKDSLGRSLHLRNPNILDMYDLRKALKEDNEITSCVNLMQYVLYVKKIDEVLMDVPSTPNEARMALKLLSTEGISAIIDYAEKNNSDIQGDVNDIKK